MRLTQWQSRATTGQQAASEPHRVPSPLCEEVNWRAGGLEFLSHGEHFVVYAAVPAFIGSRQAREKFLLFWPSASYQPTLALSPQSELRTSGALSVNNPELTHR